MRAKKTAKKTEATVINVLLLFLQRFLLAILQISIIQQVKYLVRTLQEDGSPKSEVRSLYFRLRSSVFRLRSSDLSYIFHILLRKIAFLDRYIKFYLTYFQKSFIFGLFYRYKFNF